MTKTFDNEDEATNWAITWLSERGYGVRAPIENLTPITPEQLRRLHAPGLSSGGLSQRLNHPGCPSYIRKCSAGGRLLELIPNPALIDWIRAKPTPGKRLAALTR